MHLKSRAACLKVTKLKYNRCGLLRPEVLSERDAGVGLRVVTHHVFVYNANARTTKLSKVV